jgi:hypothetical protein
MSYLPTEPQTFINIKLTDDGRRLLSLGQLTFSKAILSDREINYGIDRVNGYTIACSNRILAPKDAQPVLPLNNFDGTVPEPFQSVGSARQIVSATTPSIGFFTGNSTSGWTIDTTKSFGYSKISYSSSTPDGSTTIQMTGGTYFPVDGDLMFVSWTPIQNSGYTYSTGGTIPLYNPTVVSWYRVVDADSSTSEVTLDRNLPNFGTTISTSSQAVNAYFYPFNGVEDYYGSASTIETKVWNMNIVRTSSIVGTSSSMSGYTSYGSIEFNGTKQYLGFSSETREFGIIHYTNNYSGNTYAEQLVESTVIVDIPYVMWHGTAANAGEAKNWGLTLTDYAGPTTYDALAGTTYRALRDGNAITNNIVGRVYHKLKIIIITDPELLNALTYKSNRNFTLPPLQLSSSISPKNPLTTTDATGLLQTGYSYFVTYVASSDLQYSSGHSFGYPTILNCSYISRIEGVNDFNNNPQYLQANFGMNGFPFMRNSANMDSASYSGTGWNANSVQLLVNKVDSTLNPNIKIDDLSPDNWRLISNASIGGNGVYSGGSTTINPINLLTNTFIVSSEDYTSGSTFDLTGPYSAFTINTDVNSNGLNFGDESFFFGNIQANILSTVFKTVLTVLVPDTKLNTTLNPSFNSLLDADTFITEVGILDSNNVLVGVGKPTYPIAKNSGRYIAFQLEIDF